jgi:hypothetical protein
MDMKKSNNSLHEAEECYDTLLANFRARDLSG